MKKFLLLLPALLASFAFNTPVWSIQPLTDEQGNIHCTAFSINQAKHYWATANHCTAWPVEDIETEETGVLLVTPWLNGVPTQVTMRNYVQDIAVLTATTGAPALHVQNDAPELGEQVWVSGYAYGWASPTLFQGHLANLRVDVGDPTQKWYTIFDMHGAPGHSGSPVMNAHGEFLSILQVGWRLGFTGGVPWSEMIRTLRPYME